MNRKLNFRSDTSQLAGVRDETRKFLAGAKLDEVSSNMVVLALDEACTNIIRYAYNHKCRLVRLEMNYDGCCIQFILRDYGKSCDPAKIKGRCLEEVRPGGVGVHIIRKVFDEVSYEPCGRGTRLTLTKKLQ